MISVRDVHKSYGRIYAVRGVSFDLPTGKVVGLLGPNGAGKSTLFTALTGVHSRIGNYPGVTVEKKIGQFHADGCEVKLVDLPGTYSLSPRSLDEMVSVEVLLGRQLDVGTIDANTPLTIASEMSEGGVIFAQDEDTSVVWGMPGFVARAGLAERIVALPDMAAEIVRRLTRIPASRPSVAAPARR